MKDHKKLSRRNFTVLGAAAAVGVVSKTHGEQKPPQKDVIYKEAKPSKAADLAYKMMPDGGCMFAVVKSVLSITSAQPTEVPFEMFRYGHGGCGGHGSLCGACNGAAAAIGFYVRDKKKCDLLISKVFSWYETTSLPVYKPADSEKKCAVSVSGSTLCHVSMSKWCKASGKSPFSDERKNRCGRLTADVSAKTVEVLNDYFSSNKSIIKVSVTSSNSCSPCHTKNITKGKLAKAPKVNVKMNCVTCHSDVHPE